MTDRALHWPGCANVRDLGGLPTESGAVTLAGRIVRADDIGLAGPEAWAAATAYGIGRIVDLRFPDERAKRGSSTTIEVVPVSVLGERDPVYWDMLHAERDRVGDSGYHAFSYRSFLARHAPLFARAVTAVAETPVGGAVVHCVAGKDRTGLVVGLLLRLAGVPLDVVDADYALSEPTLVASGYVAIDYRGLQRPPLSPAGVLLEVLGELEQEHGSVADWLTGAGCTPETLERARTMLLG